jgi:predicted enzyme related to lactoylglutathione lyase
MAQIICPVSEFIRTSDVDRTVSFYREILGFQVQGSEAVSGAARIQFVPGEPAHRMLFFETDDVASMRDEIAARGGKPTEIADVNWIKFRILALTDPDGHTLWFGQSYNAPDQVRPTRMLQRIMPALPLDDVPAGVAHYRDALGFAVNYEQHDIGVMDRDDVRVLLIARTPQHRGIGSAYVYVENADALADELRSRGARVQGEPVSQPWGLREFCVLDPEGNEITFGQPFE